MIEIKLKEDTIGMISYVFDKYRIELLNLNGSYWCETEQRAMMWAIELLNNKEVAFDKITYAIKQKF